MDKDEEDSMEHWLNSSPLNSPENSGIEPLTSKDVLIEQIMSLLHKNDSYGLLFRSIYNSCFENGIPDVERRVYVAGGLEAAPQFSTVAEFIEILQHIAEVNRTVPSSACFYEVGHSGFISPNEKVRCPSPIVPAPEAFQYEAENGSYWITEEKDLNSSDVKWCHYAIQPGYLHSSHTSIQNVFPRTGVEDYERAVTAENNMLDGRARSQEETEQKTLDLNCGYYLAGSRNFREDELYGAYVAHGKELHKDEFEVKAGRAKDPEENEVKSLDLNHVYHDMGSRINQQKSTETYNKYSETVISHKVSNELLYPVEDSVTLLDVNLCPQLAEPESTSECSHTYLQQHYFGHSEDIMRVETEFQDGGKRNSAEEDVMSLGSNCVSYMTDPELLSSSLEFLQQRFTGATNGYEEMVSSVKSELPNWFGEDNSKCGIIVEDNSPHFDVERDYLSKFTLETDYSSALKVEGNFSSELQPERDYSSKLQQERDSPPELQQERDSPPELQLERKYPPELQLERKYPPELQVERKYPPELQLERMYPPKLQVERDHLSKLQVERDHLSKLQVEDNFSKFKVEYVNAFKHVKDVENDVNESTKRQINIQNEEEEIYVDNDKSAIFVENLHQDRTKVNSRPDERERSFVHAKFGQEKLRYARCIQNSMMAATFLNSMYDINEEDVEQCKEDTSGVSVIYCTRNETDRRGTFQPSEGYLPLHQETARPERGGLSHLAFESSVDVNNCLLKSTKKEYICTVHKDQVHKNECGIDRQRNISPEFESSVDGKETSIGTLKESSRICVYESPVDSPEYSVGNPEEELVDTGLRQMEGMCECGSRQEKEDSVVSALEITENECGKDYNQTANKASAGRREGCVEGHVGAVVRLLERHRTKYSTKKNSLHLHQYNLESNVESVIPQTENNLERNKCSMENNSLYSHICRSETNVESVILLMENNLERIKCRRENSSLYLQESNLETNVESVIAQTENNLERNKCRIENNSLSLHGCSLESNVESAILFLRNDFEGRKCSKETKDIAEINLPDVENECLIDVIKLTMQNTIAADKLECTVKNKDFAEINECSVEHREAETSKANVCVAEGALDVDECPTESNQPEQCIHNVELKIENKADGTVIEDKQTMGCVCYRGDYRATAEHFRITENAVNSLEILTKENACDGGPVAEPWVNQWRFGEVTLDHTEGRIEDDTWLITDSVIDDRYRLIDGSNPDSSKISSECQMLERCSLGDYEVSNKHQMLDRCNTDDDGHQVLDRANVGDCEASNEHQVFDRCNLDDCGASREYLLGGYNLERNNLIDEHGTIDGYNLDGHRVEFYSSFHSNKSVLAGKVDNYDFVKESGIFSDIENSHFSEIYLKEAVGSLEEMNHWHEDHQRSSAVKPDRGEDAFADFCTISGGHNCDAELSKTFYQKKKSDHSCTGREIVWQIPACSDEEWPHLSSPGSFNDKQDKELTEAKCTSRSYTELSAPQFGMCSSDMLQAPIQEMAGYISNVNIGIGDKKELDIEVSEEISFPSVSILCDTEDGSGDVTEDINADSRPSWNSMTGYDHLSCDVSDLASFRTDTVKIGSEASKGNETSPCVALDSASETSLERARISQDSSLQILIIGRDHDLQLPSSLFRAFEKEVGRVYSKYLSVHKMLLKDIESDPQDAKLSDGNCMSKPAKDLTIMATSSKMSYTDRQHLWNSGKDNITCSAGKTVVKCSSLNSLQKIFESQPSFECPEIQELVFQSQRDKDKVLNTFCDSQSCFWKTCKCHIVYDEENNDIENNQLDHLSERNVLNFENSETTVDDQVLNLDRDDFREGDTTVRSGFRDTSVHSESRDTSVHRESRETSVHSGFRDTSVHSGSRDTFVHSVYRDTSVHSGFRDTSVHSRSRDTSVHSKSREIQNLPVIGGITKADCTHTISSPDVARASTFTTDKIEQSVNSFLQEDFQSGMLLTHHDRRMGLAKDCKHCCDFVVPEFHEVSNLSLTKIDTENYQSRLLGWAEDMACVRPEQVHGHDRRVLCSACGWMPYLEQENTVHKNPCNSHLSSHDNQAIHGSGTTMEVVAQKADIAIWQSTPSADKGCNTVQTMRPAAGTDSNSANRKVAGMTDKSRAENVNYFCPRKLSLTSVRQRTTCSLVFEASQQEDNLQEQEHSYLSTIFWVCLALAVLIFDIL